MAEKSIDLLNQNIISNNLFLMDPKINNSPYIYLFKITIKELVNLIILNCHFKVIIILK